MKVRAAFEFWHFRDPLFVEAIPESYTKTVIANLVTHNRQLESAHSDELSSQLHDSFCNPFPTNQGRLQSTVDEQLLMTVRSCHTFLNTAGSSTLAFDDDGRRR